MNCNQSWEIVLWLIEVVSVLNCENSFRLLAIKRAQKGLFPIVNFTRFCLLKESTFEMVEGDKFISIIVIHKGWWIIKCHVCQMLSSQME